MVEVLAGVVLTGMAIAFATILVRAIMDWRFWRCLIFGHRWQPVEPFTHRTGVLSMTKRYRCACCSAVPTIADEAGLRRKARV